MQQLSLPTKDLTPWDVLLGRIESAVHHLGLKEVTFRLNVAKSTLCDALKDRNERRWAHEWTLTVLEMLRDQYTDTCNQLAKEILDVEAAITKRYQVVDADEEPTPAEIEAAERVLALAKKRRRAA